MRTAILAWAAAVALLAGGIDPAVAANAQQDRMKACNAEAAAKNLGGDARKQFMSNCLSGSASAAAASKEHACMAQADSRKLSGAARTSFMKKCVGS